MNGISSSPSHCFSDPHLGMNPRPPPNPPTNCLLSVQSIKIWHRTPCFMFLRVGTTALYFDHLTRPGPVAHQDMPPPETLKIYALPLGRSASVASKLWELIWKSTISTMRNQTRTSWQLGRSIWKTGTQKSQPFPREVLKFLLAGSQTNLVTWGDAFHSDLHCSHWRVADWGAADWSPERNFQTGALDLGGDGSHSCGFLGVAANKAFERNSS